MILVLQLSTQASQPSLQKVSLLIQIQRPWQSVRNIRTEINGRKQLRLSKVRLRKVFTNVIPTPPRIFPIGFKCVFIRKRNENNEVVRYKAMLDAQSFT
jgi:hypothetical protein